MRLRPLAFAIPIFLGFSLTSCGYAIPRGDVHKKDPFFPRLGGDSGFVTERQVLAGARCVQIRLLKDRSIEALSVDTDPKQDSLRTIFVQRFDSSGRELGRISKRIVDIYSPNPIECRTCSDGRQVLDEGTLLEPVGPDSILKVRRIERFKFDGDWMNRTFGSDFDHMHDSVGHIGELLDSRAGNHLLQPKRDSVCHRFDSTVYARVFLENGIDSLHYQDYGGYSWVLGFDRKHRPLRIDYEFGQADMLPTTARCSSLVLRPGPESPLRAWDSSVIENSSSGNHFVFGFNPHRMTYHRIRIGGREARFKLYDYSKQESTHVRYFLGGSVELPNSVWIVAGGPGGNGGAPARDTLYRIHLDSGHSGGARASGQGNGSPGILERSWNELRSRLP